MIEMTVNSLVIDQGQLGNERQSDNELKINQLFDVVKEQSLVISGVISRFGNQQLSTYLSSTSQVATDYYQDRWDLLGVISRYASTFLGESIGKQVSSDLQKEPVVITANHHGVDCFAQSVQGTLLSALRGFFSESGCRTVTVLSFGNVPMNNLTFPRGLLIYQVPQWQIENSPIKLAIFPDRDKRKMVSVVAGYDREMIQKAQATRTKWSREEKITKTIDDTINEILEKGFGLERIIAQSDYSCQAILLNSFIWKKLFVEDVRIPELVYLEIEKITTELLELDLTNSSSLAWCVLFDNDLRNEIINELDNSRACWSKVKLKQRFEQKQGEDGGANNNSGTLFFWGVDSHGRRVPLTIEPEKGNNLTLQGIDDSGRCWLIPFQEERVLEALRAGQLIPSLFTCFLVVAFARGFTCLGGYFQAQYLPRIQTGLVKALLTQKRYKETARLVSKIPTDGYLSGMQVVMSEIDGKYLVPAGPIEIIAGGGLNNRDIERILALTVREAHLASLVETAADLIPRSFLWNGWKTQLASNCKELLGDRLVIK